MIQAVGLTKRYGLKTVVRDLSFELPGGQIVGFLGPNGAGKTTTLRMLTGLAQPSAGTARLGPYEVTTEPARASHFFGYVPDSPFLFPKLTGREFLHFIAAVRKIPPGSVDHFLDRWVERFELKDHTEVYLDQCSLGIKRKWATLAAILHEPRVLMLDEPLNGLDPRSIRVVKDLFQELRAIGCLILLSSHLLDVVSAVCDSVMVIHQGILVLPLISMADLPSLEETFMQLTEAAPSVQVNRRQE